MYSASSNKGVEQQRVEYTHGDVLLEGILCYPKGIESNRRLPIVLVCHAFRGRGEFEVSRAVALAEQGYASFAIDLYGKGVVGTDFEKCRALMTPLSDDRGGLLLNRLKLVIETVKSQPMVDPNKIAAIGYCFGGMCALDLARANADVQLVVSLHGTLTNIKDAIDPKEAPAIHASVQVLHGYDDPHIPMDQVIGFMKEMTDRRADWQLHAYGNACHGFTEPDADKLGFPGVGYNRLADERSWRALSDLLVEKFGNVTADKH